MPGVTNGAKLVKMLIESGTPEASDGPLIHARRRLAEVYAAESRVATASEVAAALSEGLGADHGTAVKARNLIATGSASPPKTGDARPIEDQLLGQLAQAPVKPVAQAPVKPVAQSPVKPVAQAPVAGVETDK